jgi:hypothetical protein
MFTLNELSTLGAAMEQWIESAKGKKGYSDESIAEMERVKQKIWNTMRSVVSDAKITMEFLNQSK